MAKTTGLTEYTLRYYERIGLVKFIARKDNGHRQYSSNDLQWIEFLMRLRATGMPIRDMQRFAELRYQGDKTVAKRKAMLIVHLEKVQQHINEWMKYKRVLIQKIEYYSNLKQKR